MRYMLMRCTPMRYTPNETSAYEVHAHETYVYQMHAYQMHAREIHGYRSVAFSLGMKCQRTLKANLALYPGSPLSGHHHGLDSGTEEVGRRSSLSYLAHLS